MMRDISVTIRIDRGLVTMDHLKDHLIYYESNVHVMDGVIREIHEIQSLSRNPLSN